MESIIAQDYPNIDIIVMDGGSIDGTHEALDEFNGLKKFIQAGDGPKNALLDGIKKSSGELIMFMFVSDSYANIKWISTCVEELNRSPDVSLCWGLPRYMSEDGSIGRVSYPELLNKTDLSRRQDFVRWLATGVQFPEMNMCTRREVIDKILHDFDPHDSSIDIFLEFTKRFHMDGYMSKFIPTVANYGRLHSGQLGSIERTTGLLSTRERNYRSGRLLYARRILCSSQQHQFRLPNGAPVGVLTLGFADRIWIGFLIIVNESKRAFIKAAIAAKARGLRVRSYKF